MLAGENAQWGRPGRRGAAFNPIADKDYVTRTQLASIKIRIVFSTMPTSNEGVP
jgi:hypothetical protein